MTMANYSMNHVTADELSSSRPTTANENDDDEFLYSNSNTNSPRGVKRPASPHEVHKDGMMDDTRTRTRTHNNSNKNTHSTNINNDVYCMLPIHGEHKRAVSCVSFAPTLRGSHSIDNDPSRCHLDSPIVCASASADGSVRLWDITKSYHKSQGRECYYSSHNDNGEGITNANGTYNGYTDDHNDDDPDHDHHQHHQITPESGNGNGNASSSSKLMSPIAHITGHSRGINDLAWSPRTPNLLATASDDKTLRIWDVTRSSSSSSSSSSPSSSISADANNNNNNDANTVGQPSTGTGHEMHNNNHANSTDNVSDALVEFKGHSNFCFSVQFSPQGNLLVSGSFDETVKVWDVRTGICVSTLPAHSDPVTGVDFNRDGTCIVSCSHDGLMRIWDVATNECLKTIYAEKNPPVTFVKYSPNGKYILSGMLDGKLRLWNVMGRNNGYGGVGVNGVGGGNGTGTGAGTGAASTVEDAMMRNKLSGNGNGGNGGNGGGGGGGSVTPGVNSLSIGLTTAQGRGGQCTKTYEGHINSNYCIFSAFSIPYHFNGTTGIGGIGMGRQSVVTGSEDGCVYVYDLQTRKIRQKLHAHSDACLAVACHDREEIFASGGMSNDRLVKFWVPKVNHDID